MGGGRRAWKESSRCAERSIAIKASAAARSAGVGSVSMSRKSGSVGGEEEEEQGVCGCVA